MMVTVRNLALNYMRDHKREIPYPIDYIRRYIK